MLGAIRASGRQVLEATCPLVSYAHRCLRKLVEQGYHPVVIGKQGHVEVRGLTEDFEQCDVILSDEDVANLRERSHFGVISQTTQPIQKVRSLVQLIRERFPKSTVRFMDTVCQPTKQRQSAAAELAQAADVVIVVGGANSNNTQELVAACQRYCACVHHVQSADDLQRHWFEDAETAGLTAGTSTPDAVIDAVERRIRSLVCELQPV
jgi:4-hydroxy-3-methylbut-2-en-1-yl diphosphate reductase